MKNSQPLLLSMAVWGWLRAITPTASKARL